MRRTKTFSDLTAMEQKTQQTSKRKQRKTPTPPSTVHRWACAGVGITLALSGWLNGLAFSSSASTPLNGWVLGIAIPVLVLVFSRVSAILYAEGQRQLAYAGGVATVAILALSVQHCAVSIASLTGEPVVLAGLMAVAIDLGLVVSEVATIHRKNRR
jgi:mannose/fructose/N-acetylgalactosamine-specific phosphotransferase system component IID